MGESTDNKGSVISLKEQVKRDRIAFFLARSDARIDQMRNRIVERQKKERK